MSQSLLFRPILQQRTPQFLHRSLPRVAVLSPRKMSTSATNTSPFSTLLISPSTLQKTLTLTEKPKSRILPLSASWYLPNAPTTGHASFLQSHIPSSVFFDLDAISSTPPSPYPHMLPSPQKFATAMNELGIKRNDTIVVYDTADLGLFSAPRVAWTFRIFGHPNVHILNNYKLWVEQGYPTESGEVPTSALPPTSTSDPYPTPSLDTSQVVPFEEMHSTVSSQKATTTSSPTTIILDARPAGRFTGASPEPRPGLPSGHMPTAINIPHTILLDPSTKTLLPKEQLRKVFEERGVKSVEGKQVICSCGTGVTATVVELGLEEAGLGRGRVYDGSWTEWAQRTSEGEGLIVKD
ncbi:MAG: hypothetical protein M1834_003607 [Cirrosporium novae-zelandiae]|nr:MAG: hypothetical protein M1834_003607 [Cirrosporium novae-zelandiae]